jgi:hypothetical protein
MGECRVEGFLQVFEVLGGTAEAWFRRGGGFLLKPVFSVGFDFG